METTQFINTLIFAAYLTIPVMAAVLGGALVAAILRVSTQIDDQAVAFAGRLAGFVLLVYFAAGRFISEITSFTSGFWGNTSFYH